MDQPDDTGSRTGTPAEAPHNQTMTRGFNQDVGAGLLLIAIASAGLLASSGLRLTLPSGVGPGLMPRATALILGAFGLLFVIQGLTTLGPRLEAWSLRGMLFLLGAVAVFAASVRPMGLAVAGPLALIIAAMADAETRLREILPFAIVLTAICIVLFKYLLRQPIPLAPFLLGY